MQPRSPFGDPPAKSSTVSPFGDPPAGQPKNKKPSFLQQNINAAKATGQDIVGAAKSYGNAAANIGQGALDVMTLGADRLVPGAKETKAKISKAMEPTSEQMLGYGAGEASQYFLPLPGLEQMKAAEGAGKLAKAGLYGAARRQQARRHSIRSNWRPRARSRGWGRWRDIRRSQCACRRSPTRLVAVYLQKRPASVQRLYRKVTEETLLGGGGMDRRRTSLVAGWSGQALNR